MNRFARWHRRRPVADVRIVASSATDASFDKGYAMQVRAAIEARRDNHIHRSVVWNYTDDFRAGGDPEQSGKILADAKVIPFQDPRTGRKRWAVDTRSGSYVEIYDYPDRRSAYIAYRDIVIECQSDQRTRYPMREHAWDVTDVPSVPMNRGGLFL